MQLRKEAWKELYSYSLFLEQPFGASFSPKSSLWVQYVEAASAAPVDLQNGKRPITLQLTMILSPNEWYLNLSITFWTTLSLYI